MMLVHCKSGFESDLKLLQKAEVQAAAESVISVLMTLGVALRTARLIVKARKLIFDPISLSRASQSSSRTISKSLRGRFGGRIRIDAFLQHHYFAFNFLILPQDCH
jgi:hypothetical protein